MNVLKMNFIYELDLEQGDLFKYMEKYFIFIRNVGQFHEVFSITDLKVTCLMGSFRTATIVKRFNS